MDQYTHERVPIDARQSLLSLAMILAGVPLCVSGLLAGAALSETQPFAVSIQAVLLGSLIVTLYAACIGLIGARKGLTTTLLLRECFGKTGAAVVAFVLAICLGGWFAVQGGFFGQTVHELFPGGGVVTSVPVAALWGGALMVTTAYYGYSALKLLSTIAVPLIVILSAWGLSVATQKVNIWEVMPGQVGTLGEAVTLIVGSFAVGATVNADITRFAKHWSHALIATVVGFFIANVYILLSGAATALATSSGDLVAAMAVLGLGAPALVILILGQWTTNDNNLYAATVNLSSAMPGVKKNYLVIVCGTAATLCGAIGIADIFVPFLIWLGILIPPIGGVLISHNLFFSDQDRSERQLSAAAFSAWIVGSLIGAYIPIGIPAVNSVVSSLFLYTVVCSFYKRVLQ